jgi:hypothetical protein
LDWKTQKTQMPGPGFITGEETQHRDSQATPSPSVTYGLGADIGDGAAEWEELSGVNDCLEARGGRQVAQLVTGDSSTPSEVTVCHSLEVRRGPPGGCFQEAPARVGVPS